jgi:hypothetical protein
MNCYSPESTPNGLCVAVYACIAEDSSVGIAMGYGLNGRGSIPDRGKVFSSHNVQTGPGTHPPSYTMGTGGFLPGGKATGA